MLLFGPNVKTMAILAVKDLTYSYGGETMLRFPDFEMEKGEHALILGSSGSGKTTFLHLIGGLLKAHSGSVSILDNDWTRLSNRLRDKYRGQHMGFIFQTAHFIPSLTVFENLAIGAHLAGKPLDKNWTEHLLERLNILDKQHRSVRQLSVGEQQRVAIARALVNRPEILLADEPTSALDDDNCGRVIELLENCASETSSSLLIVTHDNRLKGRYNKEIILTKQIRS